MMNLARSSAKLTIATTASAAVTFIGIAYFARLLEPGELGVFFLFEALLGILVIPADFGLRGAVEKRISEGERPGRILSTAVLLKFIPLIVIVSVVLVVGGIINSYVGENIAIWLAIGIVSHELYQLGIKVLSGELRVGETAVIKLTQKVVWAGIGVILIRQGFGVHGVIFGTIASFLVAFTWAMYRRSTPIRRPSHEVIPSLTSYSKYNFISALSGYFYSWMDVLIIGFFLTAAHVGAYETAWRVTALVVLGSKAIAMTIFPQISRWDSEEAINRIEWLIPRAVTPSLLIVVPAFFGTILLSRDILTYVFGPEYVIAWIALVILMGEKVFQSVHDITGRSLKAIDHPELAARAAVVSILINFVLNLVLIWQFGLIGAAFATLLASLINTAMCIGYLSRFISVQLSWNELGWLVASSTGMILVLVSIQSAMTINSLLQLLFVITVGAVIYMIFIFLYPPMRIQAVRSARMLTGKSETLESAKGGD